MIIATKADKHDESWRIVLYDRGDDGERSARPKLTHAEFHDEIDTYYEQRQLERDRLYERLLAGQTSPVGFYLELQGMDVADVAKRAGLRPGLVRRHLTVEGFRRASVDQLGRYARIFDVSIADFFWFGRPHEGVEVEVAGQQAGLLQLVDFRPVASVVGQERR